MHRLSILVLLASALGAQTTPDRGVNFYSIEKEQVLGAQLAAAYRRGVTPIDSPAAAAYLDDLGRRLVAQSQSPPYTYTFELVDAAADPLNEPVAFPGGPVFVSAQLIFAAKSEDELAGMLAHSIAHTADRHGAKQATRGQIVNQATIPLIFMGGWERGPTVPMGFVKLQRQMELQADSLAARAMSGAGYNPTALLDYIARVQPTDEARLQALRDAIDVVPAAAYPPHDGLAAIQREIARLTAKPANPAKAPPRLAR